MTMYRSVLTIIVEAFCPSMGLRWLLIAETVGELMVPEFALCHLAIGSSLEYVVRLPRQIIKADFELEDK
jgi:hypothetical protein